jgi:hypothetical protein
MTVVRLKRHAPEAQNSTQCAVCGTVRPGEVTDHVQVGTPGAPHYDEGVCDSCGAVLDRVVDRYGANLNVTVEEAQREASDRERTIPRKPE